MILKSAHHLSTRRKNIYSQFLKKDGAWGRDYVLLKERRFTSIGL
jgi:hypothetical protein